MRMMLYICILALLLLAPVEPANLADLLPVEAVAVYIDKGEVVVETDTGHKGRGVDPARAFLNLKAGTPAVIFLDTTKFLLIEEDVSQYAAQLKCILKPSVRVCVCGARGMVGEVGKYLSVHGNLPKLKEWTVNAPP